MSEVKITILPSGEAEIDIDGMRGRSCQDVVDGLTKALGVSVGRRKKPEFYQTSQNAGGVKQG